MQNLRRCIQIGWESLVAWVLAPVVAHASICNVNTDQALMALERAETSIRQWHSGAYQRYPLFREHIQAFVDQQQKQFEDYFERAAEFVSQVESSSEFAAQHSPQAQSLVDEIIRFSDKTSPTTIHESFMTFAGQRSAAIREAEPVEMPQSTRETLTWLDTAVPAAAGSTPIGNGFAGHPSSGGGKRVEVVVPARIRRAIESSGNRHGDERFRQFVLAMARSGGDRRLWASAVPVDKGTIGHYGTSQPSGVSHRHAHLTPSVGRRATIVTGYTIEETPEIVRIVFDYFGTHEGTPW